MFSQIKPNIMSLRDNDYYQTEKFKFMMLLKIADKEGIINKLSTLDYFNEYIEEEECYPIIDIALEILSFLYGFSYECETEDETGLDTIIFTIENEHIKEYYEYLKTYQQKYGEKKALEYEKYVEEKNWLGNISSYCYDVDYIKNSENIIEKIKITINPEFDLYCDLVYAIYDLMNAYNQAISNMKKELHSNVEFRVVAK